MIRRKILVEYCVQSKTNNKIMDPFLQDLLKQRLDSHRCFLFVFLNIHEIDNSINQVFLSLFKIVEPVN